jgi:hypothetical protein
MLQKPYDLAALERALREALKSVEHPSPQQAAV